MDARREEIAAAAKRVLTVFNDLSNPKPIAERLIWSDLGDCARVALEAMEAETTRTSCAKCGAWTHKPVHINLPEPIKCNGAFTVEDIRRPTGDGKVGR